MIESLNLYEFLIFKFLLVGTLFLAIMQLNVENDVIKLIVLSKVTR